MTGGDLRTAGCFFWLGFGLLAGGLTFILIGQLLPQLDSSAPNSLLWFELPLKTLGLGAWSLEWCRWEVDL
jgi:hypothetical protein